ncbi:SMP-30/gluconolactonase/LRE family protein [Streptomyces sp. NPDC093252]|uniref:SMP-30/gluconolactonase/LRE family protein n=1 Tax=Streptomyces sp. NPDC093252 TaxID=3154980 RepID=UPI00342B9CDE
MSTRYDIAVRAEALLGEGATWDADAARLIWVDILGCRVHTYDPATGHRTVRTTGRHVGAAKPRAGGGLVLSLRDGVALLDPDGTFGWLHHDPVPGRRANDAAVAPDGSLWAGTMCDDETPGGATLTRHAPDGTAQVILPDVTVGNGAGWSPDGTLFYYVDTATRRVDVFDHDPDGEGAARLRDRRTLTTIGTGFPDGLTVDADGCVWVALWDGGAVHRYTPDGVLDRVLEVPAPRVTSCAFGGPGLRDLYLTTARTGLSRPTPLSGSVLVVRGAGQGLPQPAFGG